MQPRKMLLPSLAFAMALTCQAAWSQTPKTIKLIVPVPPGSGADVTAHLLAEQIGRAQGPVFVFENRPGAGGTIAAESASRAAADGSTLLIHSNPLIINPHLNAVNYDPLTSLEPICHLVSSPTVIVVNSASPYRTLADLISTARAKSGELTLGGLGPGSAVHIGFEMLKRAAGVDITFVPYPGSLAGINALLGEHVTSSFAIYAQVAELINAGKLRALATTSRIEALPNVPSLTEAGYRDVEADVWQGLFAPAKTPKHTLSRIGGWFTASLQAPDIKPKLLAQQLYPVGMCGADFGAHLRKQYEAYGRVIREANIKAQ